MFNKNIRAIDNIALQRRLSRITPEESRIGISYCVTPSNDYVLLKDDIATDDLQNPREAIKKVLKENVKNDMKPNDIIINFGLGLGYLLDETFNNYPSRIYIYEPDINLMHFVLSNVDISEHLESGRVFITNDLDELVHKLTTTFLTKDKVEIVYLPNYALTKNKELLMLTQKVFDACKSKMVDVNTITKFSQRWLLNTIENIAYLNNNDGYLLSSLNNKFTGKTAMIIAAGPSLNENIEKLQANRNKFVIFAVNKVVNHLLQNGITPDFIVCLDAGNMDATLGGTNPLYEKINCIMDVRSDNALTTKNFKKLFYTFSTTDFFAQKLAKYNNSIELAEFGGSATTLALYSAVKMGFSKIVLAGVDLAFKDNVIYSNGETMNRISQEQIIVDNVAKNIVQVKSVNGNMVYTREDYQTAIHHFETLIKELNHKEIYNLSTFGAHIEGTINSSFDEIHMPEISSLHELDYIKPFKLELKDFIQEEFFHINNVITLLSKGSFSPSLVSTIVKSVLLYQYLQAEILTILQKNFAQELAEPFIDNTKKAIKTVVERLQANKLI